MNGGQESVGQILSAPLESGQTYILEYYAAYSLNDLIPGLINPQINIFLEHDNAICDNTSPTSINGGMVPTDPNALQFNHVFNVGPQTWEHVRVCFTADNNLIESLYITPGNAGFLNALVNPNGNGYISYFVDEISITAVTNDPISVTEIVVNDVSIEIGDCETPICLFTGVNDNTFNTFEVEWTIDLDDQPCTNNVGISLPIILDVILPPTSGVTYLNSIGDSFDSNLQVTIPSGSLAAGGTITLLATFQFNSSAVACQGIPIQLTLDPNSLGGCLIHDPFVNIIPSDMTLEGNITTSICFGGCIDITPDCFVGPLTFSWADENGTVFSTDEDLCELEPGTYTVTVTDPFCDVETATFVVAFNSIMEILSLTSTPACFSDCSGSITVTIDPQIFPYTYTLNPGGVVIITNNTTATFNNLCPDVYSVNVQSGNLAECDVTGYITIGQPLVTMNITNETCTGSCDGWGDPTVIGNGPFGYNWTDFTSPQNQEEIQTDLCTGNYTLIVTDGNSCTTTIAATIDTDQINCCPDIVMDIEETPNFNYPGAMGAYMVEILNDGIGDIISYDLIYNLDPDFDFGYFVYTDEIGLVTTSNIISSLPSSLNIMDGNSISIQIFGIYTEAGDQPITISIESPSGNECNTSESLTYTHPIFIGCPAGWTDNILDCEDDQCFTTCLHFFDAFPEDGSDNIESASGQLLYDSGYLTFCGIVDDPNGILGIESVTDIITGMNGPSGFPMGQIDFTVDYNLDVAFYNSTGGFPIINDVVCLQFSTNTPPPTNFTQIQVNDIDLIANDGDGDNTGTIDQDYVINNVPTDGGLIYFTETNPGDCWMEVTGPNAQFVMMPEPPLCDGTIEVTANETEGLHIWDFGDDILGSVLWGANAATHTYLTNGFYTITHTVIVDGWASIETFEVEVIITPSHPTGYQASNGDIWSNVNYQFIQDLHISAGVSMNISNSILRFGGNAGVIIEPGGSLTVDNTTLTNFICEADLWWGIDVRGNANLSQTLVNQGNLRIDNCIVEHSVHAIRNHNRADNAFSPSSAGGMITSVYTTFLNNKNGIKLSGYALENSKVFIYNSKFLVDETYYYTPDAMDHVYMYGVRGVKVQGCAWSNFHNGWFDGSPTREMVGIRANLSTFSVTPNCQGYPPFTQVNCPLESSIMEGLSYGIYALTCTPTIDQTTFKCFRGVYVEGSKLMRLTRNSFFELPPAFLTFNPIGEGFLETYHYGSYFNKCSGYWFEENEFNFPGPPDWDFDGQGDDYGSVIRGSGTAYNLVYRNTFKNTMHGTYSKNINRSANAQQGLKIECNDYEDNHDDIAVWHDVPSNSTFGISAWQGFNNGQQGAQTAGNKFSDSDNELEVKNGEGWVSYWTTINENLIDWTNMTVSTLLLSDTNNCESNIPNSHSEHFLKMTESQSIDVQVDNLKTQWLSLVDDGNTEALSEEVIYADFSEAVDLYYQLMATSPRLSERVMIEAIEKEVDLPASLLTLILASNPTAAKAPDVQRAINDRLIPLDEYQKMMIDGGLALISQKEQLESQLSSLEGRSDNLVIQAIHMMWNDEELYDRHNVAIATALNRHKPEFDAVAAILYLQLGNNESAQNIFDGIVTTYNIDGAEEQSVTNDLNALQIWIDMMTLGNSQLGVSQIGLLENLSSEGVSESGGLAASVLNLYEGTYEDEPLAPMPDYFEVRIAQQSQEEQSKVLIYPNPTQSFVVIKLIDFSIQNGHLELKDAKGNMVLSKSWPLGQLEYVLELEGITSSRYSLVLFDGPDVIQESSLIITK